MQCRGAKSFVDDLGLSRGVVLSRAAASLRSIETKPFDSRICPLSDGPILDVVRSVVWHVRSVGLFGTNALRRPVRVVSAPRRARTNERSGRTADWPAGWSARKGRRRAERERTNPFLFFSKTDLMEVGLMGLRRFFKNLSDGL